MHCYQPAPLPTNLYAKSAPLRGDCFDRHSFKSVFYLLLFTQRTLLHTVGHFQFKFCEVQLLCLAVHISNKNLLDYLHLVFETCHGGVNVDLEESSGMLNT